MNKGKIVQIIGPVVDVEFPEALPAIYNALTAEYVLPGCTKTKLTFEVQQHLGDDRVRRASVGGWRTPSRARLPVRSSSAGRARVRGCRFAPPHRASPRAPRRGRRVPAEYAGGAGTSRHASAGRCAFG